MDGFQIRGENEEARVEIDYVPGLKAVTHFAEYDPGTLDPGFRLELKSAGKQSTWAWYTEKPRAFGSGLFGDPTAFDPSNPTTTLPVYQPTSFDVAEGDDQVIIWALSSIGSRATVIPPPPEPAHVYDGAGSPHYELGFFAATPGTWVLTGIPGSQDGWAYLQSQVVQWIDGP
jgi:hypothetical protein